jgi:uncharacterized protein YkwD
MESGTCWSLRRRTPRRNSVRTTMLMPRSIAVTFALLAAICGPCAAQNAESRAGASSGASSSSNSSSNSNEDSAAEKQLLDAANKSRQLAGTPPLRMDDSLRQAAVAHARLMISSDRLEHQFPGELGLMERIAQVSSSVPSSSDLGPRIDRAGENVAYAPSALGVHDALMHSPPHRENLLDWGFNAVGLAAVWSGGKLFVVEDFAHELPSYSAHETSNLVGQAIADMRQQAALPGLVQLTPASLDTATCSLAKESHPSAHLLATAFDNRRVITYTQSRPEMLPQGVLPMLRDAGLRQFAVGSCYARNAAYPNGTYWVAILLY